uniref:DBF4-type domain-containing protein n=2 Tax=Suricata suricatta TaxID=37032 RepID=A0A673VKS0_SURSU
MTRRSSRGTREPEDREPSPRSATRTQPRRRKGFCECCREAFEELHAHLQSAQHQGFALEAHPYAEVDRVIAQLSHSLVDTPFRAGSPRQLGSPCSDRDLLCPETPPPGRPCHPRAAPPRMKEEDVCQASGTPEQAGTAGSKKAPDEPMGAGKMLGPLASCQELGESVDVIADPPETPVSRSPAHQCLLTSSGSTELSGPDVALVGHKRKMQLPSGNPEKRSGVSRPQASFFVPRATSPCGARTASGRHPVSLPPPDCEYRPLVPLFPWCHPETCLPLSTDGPAEGWTTQPPWPGEESPPRSEGSECPATGPG